MKYKTIILLSITNISLAQQVCKLESEVPSTTPDSRFTDNSNGTITDNGTGLMWQKCHLGLAGSTCTKGSETILNWQQALDESENYSLAGFSDWRLPNRKELLSIIEQRCYNPKINVNYFPNARSYSFWSSSPYARYSGYAWIVNFSSGFSGYESRYSNYNVRLVRSGQ